MKAKDLIMGGTYRLAEWTVRVVGPVYTDPRGGDRTTPCIGSTIRRGWFVVNGPSGPMRARACDLKSVAP